MERRKIIIPLDTETAARLETPHFDSQATTAARRVVPLGASENSGAPSVSTAAPSATYSRTNAAPPKSNNRLIIGLLALVALLAGALGGLVFGLYQMNSNGNTANVNEATVQTSPTPAEPNGNESALGVNPDTVPTATPTPNATPTPTPRANSNNANDDDDNDQDDVRNNNNSGGNQNRNANSRNVNTNAAPSQLPPRPSNNNAGANRNANAVNRRGDRGDVANRDSDDNGDTRARRTRQNNNGANSNNAPERILPPSLRNTVNNGVNRVREIFEGQRPRPSQPPQ